MDLGWSENFFWSIQTPFTYWIWNFWLGRYKDTWPDILIHVILHYEDTCSDHQHSCISEFDCQYLQYVNFSSSDSQNTNMNLNLNENHITWGAYREWTHVSGMRLMARSQWCLRTPLRLTIMYLQMNDCLIWCCYLSALFHNSCSSLISRKDMDVNYSERKSSFWK